eukprot:comp16957_c0_seq1/m.15569 comp16957_c0_seq1/g.15569  ORF comp16957_c0_seq1/g.15569 comp16957_c0_seq1/m.15569 type:complete len:119 (-) comp16957_c0_seq1:404-760(-)
MSGQAKDGLIAIIGDEDTVTGFLLAGVGDVDQKKRQNYMIVKKDTSAMDIEEAFKKFTARTDIAVVLINQHIANEIRYVLDKYVTPVPAVLEIPSKEKPYDPSKDSILTRAKGMFSSD